MVIIKPVADESDEENDNDSGGGDAGGEGDESGGEDLVDDGGALLHDVQLNLVVDLGQVLCGVKLYKSVSHNAIGIISGFDSLTTLLDMTVLPANKGVHGVTPEMGEIEKLK